MLDDQAVVLNVAGKGLVVIIARPLHWVAAQHAMSHRFGEAFIPNAVGTRFLL